MHRLRQWIFWSLVLIAAGCALVVIGANLYVQSQGTQKRLKQELSQRLGMPLRIRRISVSPWGGLVLSGITLDDPEGKEPFLKAKSFRLHVRWRSIFHGPIVISDVTLNAPAVTWPQDQSGRWKLPGSPKIAPSIASSPPPGVVAKENAPAASATVEPPVPRRNSGRNPGTVSSPQIKRFRLDDGRFEFLDQANRAVARFDGAEISSSLREGESARGQARIAKIDLRDRIHLANARSPFSYDAGDLSLSPISADWARGNVTGDFNMQTQAPDSPFAARAQFHRLQANDLIMGAGGTDGMVRGTLDGTIELKGNTTDMNSLAGTGDLALAAGHVQQLAVLAVMGQLLQIGELTQLDLEEAKTKFHLEKGEVLIDAMTLRSANLRLSATGSVSLTGRLALNSTLTLNDKVRGQLPRAFRENFVARDEPGFYALDFHVNGTVSKPRTDLMERVVGRDLRDLGGMVDAIFGKSRKKNKNKNAPLETPAPSPTPGELSPAPTP